MRRGRPELCFADIGQTGSIFPQSVQKQFYVCAGGCAELIFYIYLFFFFARRQCATSSHLTLVHTHFQRGHTVQTQTNGRAYSECDAHCWKSQIQVQKDVFFIILSAVGKNLLHLADTLVQSVTTPLDPLSGTPVHPCLNYPDPVCTLSYSSSSSVRSIPRGVIKVKQTACMFYASLRRQTRIPPPLTPCRRPASPGSF